jgi:2-dehydro-3-deoxyphosphogluconate aldolase / (4S)-4-hydroxy-2-oxoglutarate aldolase
MERILTKRIVPIVVLDQAEHALPLAEALLRAGLDIVEVTFRTAAAEGALRAMAKAFPQMLLGAGTLLTPDQVERAHQAGARFALAPGLNEKVVTKALSLGMQMTPGVQTASEIDRAYELGCRYLKFFPAEQAGGVKMLQALWGPVAHLGFHFIPTGGITPRVLPDYLALPFVAAVGGSWMVDRKLIAAGDWAQIEQLTRAALAVVQSLKSKV